MERNEETEEIMFKELTESRKERNKERLVKVQKPTQKQSMKEHSRNTIMEKSRELLKMLKFLMLTALPIKREIKLKRTRKMLLAQDGED